MAKLILNDLPDQLLQSLQAIATAKGYSVEQEVQELLENYCQSRETVLARIRERRSQMPPTSPEEIEAWKHQGRP